MSRKLGLCTETFKLKGLFTELYLADIGYFQIDFPQRAQLTEVHTPTKGDAITCWGNGLGFMPIRFWPKTKWWEQRPADKLKHLAECPQYKDNRYCYQRFYFHQIAVRVPGLPYLIDMSEDATKENQKKSVLRYEPEYVPGYEPPFFEPTLPYDAPGFQITHIGNKVVVMRIGKQPSVWGTGTKLAVQIAPRDPGIDGGIPDIYTTEEVRKFREERRTNDQIKSDQKLPRKIRYFHPSFFKRICIGQGDVSENIMLFFGASPPMSFFMIFLLLLFLVSPVVFPIQVGLHESITHITNRFALCPVMLSTARITIDDWTCYTRIPISNPKSLKINEEKLNKVQQLAAIVVYSVLGDGCKGQKHGSYGQWGTGSIIQKQFGTEASKTPSRKRSCNSRASSPQAHKSKTYFTFTK
uniref:Uncharacterized protein n=1 Tax=Romanomermis culicivorax TaxID=13658 RepID=A0A915JTS8_ROMCU